MWYLPTWCRLNVEWEFSWISALNTTVLFWLKQLIFEQIIWPVLLKNGYSTYYWVVVRAKWDNLCKAYSTPNPYLLCSILVCSSCQNKVSQTEYLKTQRILQSHSSRGYKYKIKELAGPCSLWRCWKICFRTALASGSSLACSISSISPIFMRDSLSVHIFLLWGYPSYWFKSPLYSIITTS
jgi:hypothetical protein